MSAMRGRGRGHQGDRGGWVGRRNAANARNPSNAALNILQGALNPPPPLSYIYISTHTNVCAMNCVRLLSHITAVARRGRGIAAACRSKEEPGCLPASSCASHHGPPSHYSHFHETIYIPNAKNHSNIFFYRSKQTISTRGLLCLSSSLHCAVHASACFPVGATPTRVHPDNTAMPPFNTYCTEACRIRSNEPSRQGRARMEAWTQTDKQMHTSG